MTVAHALHELTDSLLQGDISQFRSSASYTFSFGAVYRLNALTSAPETGSVSDSVWHSNFDCLVGNAKSRLTTTSMMFLKPFRVALNGFPSYVAQLVVTEDTFYRLSGRLVSGVHEDVYERDIRSRRQGRELRSNKNKTPFNAFRADPNEEVLDACPLGTDDENGVREFNIVDALQNGGGGRMRFETSDIMADLRQSGFAFASLSETLYFVCVRQFFQDCLFKAPVRTSSTDHPYYVYTEEEIDLGIDVFNRAEMHTVFDSFMIKACPDSAFRKSIDAAFPTVFDEKRTSQGYKYMSYYKLWINFVAYSVSTHRTDLVQTFQDRIAAYIFANCLWIPEMRTDRIWSTKKSHQNPIRGFPSYRYPSASTTSVCVLTLQKNIETFGAIYNTFETDNPEFDPHAQPTYSEREHRTVQQRINAIRVDSYEFRPCRDETEDPSRHQIEEVNPLTSATRLNSFRYPPTPPFQPRELSSDDLSSPIVPNGDNADDLFMYDMNAAF